MNLFYVTRFVTFGTDDVGQMNHFAAPLSNGWRIIDFKVCAAGNGSRVYHYTTVLAVRPRLWFKLLTLGIAR